jgi:hypothetical protein
MISGTDGHPELLGRPLGRPLGRHDLVEGMVSTIRGAKISCMASTTKPDLRSNRTQSPWTGRASRNE